MITGSLLLNPSKDITYGKCIKKYAKRMLLTLLVFGYPFALIKLVIETKSISLSYLVKALLNVVTGNTFAHLWYVYALIGIYLILPLTKAFTDKQNKKDIETLLIVLFIFDYCIPLLERITNINISFYIPLSYSLFWLILGHYLTYYKIDIKRNVCLVVYVVVSLLLICFELFSFNNLIYSMYDSPFAVLQAASIFLIFKNIDIKNIDKDKLWKIDRLCFCAYLIHPVFIQTTYRLLKITPMKFGGLYPLVTLFLFIIFAILAFIGSFILYQIKPLRKYIL